MARRKRINPKTLERARWFQAPHPGLQRPGNGAAAPAETDAAAGQGGGSAAPAPSPETPLAAPVSRAPIARLAGEAAAEQSREIARLQAAAEEAGRLAKAEAEGRLLTDVPIGQINPCHLTRDRIINSAVDTDDDKALRASIRAYGQRVPVELVAYEGQMLEDHLPFRYGLVAGYRRIRALRRIEKETGGSGYGTVRAIIRPASEFADAYVAMVEENEIRRGLSHYERGRIAALAAESGAFASAAEAVEELFATGSKAKRSKIRAFMTVYEELDDLLEHPETLNERIGLELAQALKTHGPRHVREMLMPRLRGLSHASDQLAAIREALAALRRPGPSPASTGGPPLRSAALTMGGRVELRRSGNGQAMIRLVGIGRSDPALSRLFDTIVHALEVDDG